MMVGIGDINVNLAVYIGNRPLLPKYVKREVLVPALAGELVDIGEVLGNHWRKIFNIYAKLAFILNSEPCNNWQAYRDNYLLRAGSKQALLFNKALIIDQHPCVNVICGKTHARTLLELDWGALTWVDSDFGINVAKSIIVCPYFDYRQLSNIKIEVLAKLIKLMK